MLNGIPYANYLVVSPILIIATDNCLKKLPIAVYIFRINIGFFGDNITETMIADNCLFGNFG